MQCAEDVIRPALGNNRVYEAIDAIREQKTMSSLNFTEDIINQPPHYKAPNGLESIDVIEAFTEDLEGFPAVCTGNAIKYILRWNKKGGTDDLRKAKWYINKLIAYLERNDNERL